MASSKQLTEYDLNYDKEFEEFLVYIKRGANVGPAEFDKAQSLIKEHPRIAIQDKNGATLLHLAIQWDSAPEIIRIILEVDFQGGYSPAKVKFKDQLPIHMLFERGGEPSLDTLNKLLESYPDSVSERNEDGVMLLHMAIERKPLSASMVAFALKVVKTFPYACRLQSHEQYPLHHCLEYAHPGELTVAVCLANRAAAAVPSKSGKLPLHMAVEKNMDTSVITHLIEAYPAALLMKMPAGGAHVLPLQFGLRAKKQEFLHAGYKHNTTQASKDLLDCLLKGAEHVKTEASGATTETSTARASCYARAAAMGKMTLSPWDPRDDVKVLEHDGRGTETLALTASQAMQPSVSLNRATSSTAKQSVGLHKFRMMRIDVRPPVRWHKPVPVEVVHGDTVANLKVAIQQCDALGKPPVDLQQLKVDGMLLRDEEDVRKVDKRNLENQTEIRLELRFDLLTPALLQNAETELVLLLLKRRPESAQEEDPQHGIPLHLALRQRSSPEVVLTLIEDYPEAVRKPLQKGDGEFAIHAALASGYPYVVIFALLKKCRDNDWTKSGHFNPERQFITMEDDDRLPLGSHGSFDLDDDDEDAPRVSNSRRVRHRNRCQVALPLHIAIEHCDNPDTVRLLFGRCPVSARCQKTKLTGLEKVLTAQRENLFQVVLKATLDADEHALSKRRPDDLRGPLHIAVLHNASNRVIKKLCAEYQEATNEKDCRGCLPIHLAVERQAGFASIRELLAANPRTVNAHDGRGRTPLQIAVTHCTPLGVIFEFARVDKTATSVLDAHGRNLLDLAARADAPPHMMKELMEHMPRDLQQGFSAMVDRPQTYAAGEALRLSTVHQNVLPNYRRRLEENSKVEDILNAFSDNPPEPQNTGWFPAASSMFTLPNFSSSSSQDTQQAQPHSVPAAASGSPPAEQSTLSSVTNWFSWR